MIWKMMSTLLILLADGMCGQSINCIPETGQAVIFPTTKKMNIGLGTRLVLIAPHGC